MRHADSSGVYQSCMVGMMHECSIGELLTGAAFMHHNDKGHDALKHYAALKGLSHMQLNYVETT